MARPSIVLPDDSAEPIVDAIEDARRSLRVKMFVFSDPALLQDLSDAGLLADLDGRIDGSATLLGLK